jgi:cobalt-zinc-cadmium efflux system outer membrane protein
MKYFIKIMVIFSVLGLPAFGQSVDSVISLETLKQEMLKNNPKFSSLEYFVEATKEKIQQSGSLPDPQLNIGVLNVPTDSYDLGQEAMTQKMIGISQKFPFFGKLDISERITEKNFYISSQYLAALKLALINQLENAYYHLYAVRKFTALMEENRQLLTDFVRITMKKYSSGQGIQQDVLKSQLEVLKVEKNIIELKQQQTSAQAQINALLSRKQNTALGKLSELPVPDIRLTFEEYQQAALEHNPKIAIGQLNIDKNQLACQLARREYWPDLTMSLNYGQRENRPDFLSGLLAVNIPLYAGSKQARKVEEAKLDLQSSTDQLRSLKNDVSLNVKTMFDEMQKHRQLLVLYRDHIVPQARQALTSAMAAYQADTVDFITLLNNQVSLLNYELEYQKLISDYNKSISDLNRICGIDTMPAKDNNTRENERNG